MQNILWLCDTEDDSNSYPTFRGTPVVGISHVGLTFFSVTLCSQRRPWFPQLRMKLGQTTSLDEIEALLNVNVRRWRGLDDPSVSPGGKEDKEGIDEDSGMHAHDLNLRGFLDEGVCSDG